MRRPAVLTALALVALSALPVHATGGPRLPRGVRVELLSHSARLVTIGASSRLQPTAVLAGRDLAARATTQEMCRRTARCVIAVNGDFFGPRDPTGPVVLGERLVRTGSEDHDALTVGPHVVPSDAAGTLTVTIDVPTAGPVEVPVNTPGTRGLAMFTSATRTVTVGAGQRALVCRVDGNAARVGTLGSEGTLRPVRLVTAGRLTVPSGAAVLLASGEQAASLGAWWHVRAHGGHLTYPRQDLQAAIGGFPQLVRDGRLTFDPASPPDDGLHPRTAVGGDARGNLWLLVVDAPVHISVPALMLRDRGATWAMNLDGGGSSTLTTPGRVLNQPLDGRQRKVASALVLTLPAPVHRPAPAARRPAPAQVVAPVPTTAPVPAPAPAVPAPVAEVPAGGAPSAIRLPWEERPLAAGPWPGGPTSASALLPAESLAVVLLATVSGALVAVRRRRRAPSTGRHRA